MNNSVMEFNNEKFGKVRVVIIEGQSWFVAKDICKSLEIKNSRDVLNRLDDDEKGVVLTDTPGGQQNMSAVNEYGLYNLILGSRKPEAKQFKRWITHEVLPEIRKTGFYSIRKPDSYMIEDKYERVKRWEEEQREADAKIEEQRRRALLAEAKVDELSPKAEHFDIAMNSDSLLSMKETANALNFVNKTTYTTKRGKEKSKLKDIGRNTLFDILREQGIIMLNSTQPYQKYINAGYFKVTLDEVETRNGIKLVPTTHVTQRGLNFIGKILQKLNYVPKFTEIEFWNPDDLKKIKEQFQKTI